MEARWKQNLSPDIIARVEAGDELLEGELDIRDLLKYYRYNPEFMRKLLVKESERFDRDSLAGVLASRLFFGSLVDVPPRSEDEFPIRLPSPSDFGEMLSIVMESGLVNFEEIYDNASSAGNWGYWSFINLLISIIERQV